MLKAKIYALKNDIAVRWWRSGMMNITLREAYCHESDGDLFPGE
jgi:hypothetical protein